MAHSSTQPCLKGRLLAPEGQTLQHYFLRSTQIICVALKEDLVIALDRRYRDRIRAIPDLAELPPHDTLANNFTYLVNADVFDPEATRRVSATRRLMSNGVHSVLFAVSSFLPGAYRDFTKACGADDCVNETHIFLSLCE